MNYYDLSDHLLPTSESYGFGQPDYWVWCGSAIRGDDKLYHMFSARWPKSLPFFSGYIAASEIVHAVSPTPEGPYEFRDIVLGDRGEEYWDGRMTHNPSIVKVGGLYCLFYIGGTYKGARPNHDELCGERSCPKINECYSSIRIGVAVSDSLYGPWQRFDEPVFSPSRDGWDSRIVTNPAPCVCPDRSILLYYRSNTPSKLCIGVARAANVYGEAHICEAQICEAHKCEADKCEAQICEANKCESLDFEPLKFERISDRPLFDSHPEINVEDPFVWHNGDCYQMLAKDLAGISGEVGSGLQLISSDGLNWEYAPQPHAYTRTLSFTDGQKRLAYHLERPNLTIEDGIPRFMCAAYGKDGGEVQPHCGNFDRMSESMTIVIPLSK